MPELTKIHQTIGELPNIQHVQRIIQHRVGYICFFTCAPKWLANHGLLPQSVMPFLAHDWPTTLNCITMLICHASHVVEDFCMSTCHFCMSNTSVFNVIVGCNVDTFPCVCIFCTL